MMHSCRERKRERAVERVIWGVERNGVHIEIWERESEVEPQSDRGVVKRERERENVG